LDVPFCGSNDRALPFMLIILPRNLIKASIFRIDTFFAGAYSGDTNCLRHFTYPLTAVFTEAPTISKLL